MLNVLRDALGFGKEENIVFGGLDANGERVFESLVAIDVFVEGNGLEVFVVLGEETEDELGVVRGEIIDNDDLKVGIVLFEKVNEVGAKPLTIVLCCKDNRDGGQRAGGFVVLARSILEMTHTEREKTVVEAQNKQTQGQQN